MKRLAAVIASTALAASIAAPLTAAADGRHRHDHGGGYDGRDRSRDDGGWGGWARGWRDAGPRWRDASPRGGDRYWWRSRPEFRDYGGPRPGFYYAPGYGYYRAAPQPASRGWRRGDYLPSPYRRYAVRDPEAFGLRTPPRGYAWVYYGDAFLLTSMASGLILDQMAGGW